MGTDPDWVSTLHCIRQFIRNRPIDTGIADFFLCVKNPSLREVKKLAWGYTAGEGTNVSLLGPWVHDLSTASQGRGRRKETDKGLLRRPFGDGKQEKRRIQGPGKHNWLPRTDSLEKTLMLGKLKAGGEGDDVGWDGWMASLNWWTWVWASFGSWWQTGRNGVL